MSSTLQKIVKKIEAVQLGLLRVESKDQKLLMQARIGKNDELLNCIVDVDRCKEVTLLERHVSLIQKDKEDYLYITCKVTDEVRKDAAIIISMEILKACWFTRRSRGSVSWLQEKYMYDVLEQEMPLAS
jgi:hypothetical protein